MNYNINGIEIDDKVINSYIDRLINKIFAVLGTYEDCVKINDYSTYYIYLDRIIIELSGAYFVIGDDNFLSLTNIITGLRHAENITHKNVKSLVFHCISIVKKVKKEV